jgi:hypothetical protein
LKELPLKKFDAEDVKDVLKDLQREINTIKSIIGEQPVVAKGYGRYGLGHDEGYGYGYGYFY